MQRPTSEAKAQPDDQSTESRETAAQPKSEKLKRKAVDTTTARDEHRERRRVEQRIEKHVKEHGTLPNVADISSASASVLPLPTALKIKDEEAPENANKDVIVRSRNTTGQVMWPATKEDIEILSDSKLLYPAPFEVEGSVIIRLVRLSDPVTSPVARTLRNRQFGIRGNEKWQLLGMGVVCAGFVYLLGFWQLHRMAWKRDLIEMRRERLSMPRLHVESSPFPWTDKVDDFVCRLVDARGVFDHSREMLVGPRGGFGDDGESRPGYLVVTPLRLEDGSTVLVNRGHVSYEYRCQDERPEVPTWVRVRGVLEEGEITNLVGRYARVQNKPDKHQFHYLLAHDLAENSNARNHLECSQALITAYDCLYEDDFKAGVRRDMPFSMRHKEDYLLFWADEHTHFNYAMQWFGMGTLFMVMTVYKFIEVSRWRW